VMQEGGQVGKVRLSRLGTGVYLCGCYVEVAGTGIEARSGRVDAEVLGLSRDEVFCRRFGLWTERRLGEAVV